MSILAVFVFVYLAVGIVYATYILFFGYDLWYAFPVNVIGGPITLLQLLYKAMFGKKSLHK